MTRVLIALTTLLFSSKGFAVEIAREAEMASAIGVPMKVVRSSNAQGGKYIATEKDFEGRASFMISVPTTGDYTLSARVLAPETASDSFYVAINDEAKQIWQLPISAAFGWVKYTRVLSLKRGSHTLHFYGRDRGTGLDSVMLSSHSK